MGFFPQAPPPLPRVLGSPFGEGECWALQGLTGKRDERFGNGKSNNQGKEEKGGDGSIHENGQQHKLCARGHWRPAEDAKLKELVSQHGPQNWNLIAEKLEGRSGKSCRLRWFNQLDPRINRKAFSEKEEERLLAAHKFYGNKWALIARLFPGRTDNAVKNHWHVIMARRQREQSNACRRRKPPISYSISPSAQSFSKRKEVSTSIVACSGESTITSTRDESASTCTDLSLNSFTSRIVPSFPNGSDEKLVTARNGIYERFGDSGGFFFSHEAPLMLVPGFDQSGCSRSSSEASANESAVTYHTSNALPHGEKNHGRDNIRLPFVDFLGVGAT